MLLYNMGDPTEALDRLAGRIEQIHIKDAARATVPGEWGQEVPVGHGEVDWDAFFAIVGDRLPDCDLVIEREAGEQRGEDIRTAAELVRRHAAWIEA
jgi:sugar phosphate isomerase/epimerase